MNLRNKISGVSAVAFACVLQGCSALSNKPIVAEPAECVCPDFTAPVAPTIVQVNEVKPCPVVKPVAPKVAPLPVAKPLNPPRTDLMMVGLVENVKVHTLNLEFKAKFDTGALFTSINAQELKKFERDGKKWARFAVYDPNDAKKKIFFELPIVRTKVIKQLSGKYQERPVVILTLSVGGIKEPVEVTLSDRTGYVYQLLIGRNFMENRMVVDMGKTFIAK